EVEVESRLARQIGSSWLSVLWSGARALPIAASGARRTRQAFRLTQAWLARPAFARRLHGVRGVLSPGQPLIVEAFLDRGLDDLEVGGKVEVGRRVETVMADVQDLAALKARNTELCALAPFHPRQDGIAHPAESLCDQRRADGAGRFAGAERDH